jgi:predicted acylesterase/phospholipase RssA
MSVFRVINRVIWVLLIACLSAGIMWLVIPGEAPPPVPILQNKAGPHKAEMGVITAPRIGSRTYGTCTRVLSIDGGGVRGLVAALILAEIERQTRRPIYQQFDLIVGASTGSILALGLTRPSNADAHRPAFSAEDLVQLYRDHSARIFPQSYAPLRYLRRLFRPKFSPQEVEGLYAAYFEDVQLREALTNIAVPAYDIEDNRRLWFASASHGTMLMRDLVRGATAAPTYFPPARLAVPARVSPKGYVALVDGALFANNPSQDALLLGQKLREQTTILLLSIGTGHSVRKSNFEQAWGWGILGWIDPLLEIAFSDPAVDELMGRTLLGKGDYFRLQVDLGVSPVEIDDSSAVATQRLEASTAQFMHQNEKEIASIVYELSLPRSPDCGLPSGADYERPDGPRIRHNLAKTQ